MSIEIIDSEEAREQRRNTRRIGTDPVPASEAEDFSPAAREKIRELVEARDVAIFERNQAQKSTALMVPPVAELVPVMTIDNLKARETFIDATIHEFFDDGVHYGVAFPGSKDLMLYKAGAEWFGSAFGVRPDYAQLDGTVDREAGFVWYRYRCDLILVGTGQIVGSAVGQCSSDEDKYKYRIGAYVCPSCGLETIRKGSAKFGGGWYCNRKEGGCGAKYDSNAAEILHQPKPGRVLNPEVLGLSHTIDAMAQKRAFVMAIRTAFGLTCKFKFYEDVEEPPDDDTPPPALPARRPDRKAAPAAPAPKPDIPAASETVADFPDLNGSDLISARNLDGLKAWIVQTTGAKNEDHAAQRLLAALTEHAQNVMAENGEAPPTIEALKLTWGDVYGKVSVETAQAAVREHMAAKV